MGAPLPQRRGLVRSRYRGAQGRVHSVWVGCFHRSMAVFTNPAADILLVIQVVYHLTTGRHGQRIQAVLMCMNYAVLNVDVAQRNFAQNNLAES